MKVNTSNLEAQGARLIKTMSNQVINTGVFSFTTDLLSLEVLHPPISPQFEM